MSSANQTISLNGLKTLVVAKRRGNGVGRGETGPTGPRMGSNRAKNGVEHGQEHGRMESRMGSDEGANKGMGQSQLGFPLF